MSIRIRQTIVMKVSQKEYEHILFIRNEMPFGQCILITHGGEPAKIRQGLKDKVYGIEKKIGPRNLASKIVGQVNES